MAVKTRRAHRSRKGSRKASRKASRKSHRKGSRKMRGGKAMRTKHGLFETAYSPVGHLLAATGEAVGTVTNTARNVAKTGLKGVNSIGRSVTGHANAAIRDVFSRKRR